MRVCTFLAVTSLVLLASCGKMEESPISNQPGASDVVFDSGIAKIYCDELQRMVTEADCTLARELVARADAGIGAFNAPSPIKRGETVLIQLVLALAPPPAPPTPPSSSASLPASQPSAPVEVVRKIEDKADTTDAADEAPKHAAPTSASAAPPPKPKPRPTPAQTVEPLPGDTVEFAPIVGRHMAAELTGDGFEIVAKSPREQDVLPDSQTSWEWSVTPQLKGLHTLTLKTIVEAEFADHKRFALRSLTTNKSIEVTVTPLGIISDFFDSAIVWLKKTENLLKAIGGLVAAAMALWLALRKRR